ncbi:MAG: hypothetical protein IH991_15285, partial [Planctomycetes bacterium]|nr:hypothetical protein [Planctomycetota bacterium]
MKLAKPFIPAADEVDQLERGDDLGSKIYRQIRTRHISYLPTTQGAYIVTPSGMPIDSSHTLTPDGMARFLSDGLKKYKSLSKKERLGDAPVARTKSTVSKFPKDGLVLSVTL